MDYGRIGNQRLKNIVDSLFKKSDRHPGGTAGALRVEAETGIRIGGRDHLAKAEQSVNALNNVLAGKRGEISAYESRIANTLRDDLLKAIRDFSQKRQSGYDR